MGENKKICLKIHNVRTKLWQIMTQMSPLRLKNKQIEKVGYYKYLDQRVKMLDNTRDVKKKKKKKKKRKN